MTIHRQDGTFVISKGGLPYHLIEGDVDYAEVAAAYAAEPSSFEEEAAPVLHTLTAKDISRIRADAYAVEADPLKYDYEEAMARGDEDADTLRDEWLAKKDEIRERFSALQ